MTAATRCPCGEVAAPGDGRCALCRCIESRAALHERVRDLEREVDRLAAENAALRAAAGGTA